MDIYITTSVLLFLGSVYCFTNTSRQKFANQLFVIFVLWLILYEGLRWQIGTDWDNYYNAFMQYEDDSHMDAGYMLFNKVIFNIYPSYTFFLLVFSTFVYCVIACFFRKFSPIPLVSLCWYYCGMVGVMGCNRQILAMAICLLSLRFVQERNLIKFLVVILIAMSFHLTALTFVPVYFFYERNYDSKVILAIVIIAFLIGLLKLVDKLQVIQYLALIDATTGHTSFEGYVGSFARQGIETSVIGSFKRILYIFLFLSQRKNIRNKLYDFFVLTYIYGCIIYLIFNGSCIQLLAGRGTMYFNVFEMLIIPYFLKYNKYFNVQMNKLVWVLFYALAFYLMQRDMQVYYLIDGYDIFRPYHSVFQSL